MTDMVEKVAKEIWDVAAWTATVDHQQYPPWAKLGEQDPNRLLCMAQARAAIRALMEPTEEMYGAALNAYPPDHTKEVWQAMLKAALDD